jgi:hypothetical protein
VKPRESMEQNYTQKLHQECIKTRSKQHYTITAALQHYKTYLSEEDTGQSLIVMILVHLLEEQTVQNKNNTNNNRRILTR